MCHPRAALGPCARVSQLRTEPQAGRKPIRGKEGEGRDERERVREQFTRLHDQTILQYAIGNSSQACSRMVVYVVVCTMNPGSRPS